MNQNQNKSKIHGTFKNILNFSSADLIFFDVLLAL